MDISLIFLCVALALGSIYAAIFKCENAAIKLTYKPLELVTVFAIADGNYTFASSLVILILLIVWLIASNLFPKADRKLNILYYLNWMLICAVIVLR